MNDLPPTSESKDDLESRLSTVESAFKLDERLKLLETSLVSRGVIKSGTPWWRDAKTITILGALIAAVLPAITTINGLLQNSRDYQRLLIEQQDKIRQTYLDRVLKPGITEGEQQRIFSLLVKLKSDPEFQQWAQEEFSKATVKIDDLTKEKSSLEAQINQIEAEKQRISTLPATQRTQSRARVQELENTVQQSQQKVTDLKLRIGEPPVNTFSDQQRLGVRGIVVTPSGVPVPNVRVTVLGAGSTLTDTRGAFAIQLPDSFKPGEVVRIQATRPMFSPISKDVVASNSVETIRLVMENSSTMPNVTR